MISYSSSHHHDRRLGVVAAGFLIGTFQLVGRSYFGQFMGSEAVAWYLQLRLLVLAVLSIWLLGVAAARGPGAIRSFAGGVRAWSAVFVVFVAYMVATTLWAPDLPLAAAKAYDLMYVAWSCVLTVAALRLCGIGSTIRGFWYAIFAWGVVLAVAGVASVFANPSLERLSVMGGGPNVFGRNMGLLTLAALRIAFQSSRPWGRFFGLMVVPFGSFLVLLSGSRGALLALLFGAITYAAIRGLDRRVWVTLLLAASAGGALLFTELGSRAISVFATRFIRLLLIEGYTSNRGVLLVDGVVAGLGSPLGGIGLAGFAQLDTFGLYPHNVFVEAFAEGGVIGLLLFCLPLLVFITRCRSGHGLGDPAITAALVLLLTSSSISGDLFDARGVFVLLLIALATQSTLSGAPTVRTRIRLPPRPYPQLPGTP